MDGLIVVDKPAGITSHDVVDQIRVRLRTKRVGHGGTLDPDATGVLVIGVGRATRLLEYAQAAPKRYRATASFGKTTSTQDASGEVISTAPAEHLTESMVASALADFRGEIEQVPPMVSAVKVAGERLYKKARRGEEIERPARRVVVYDIELLAFDPGDEPRAELEVTCSAGTYIRTLVHDLGARLGCGAFLRDLRRTASGGFTEDDAVDPSSIGPESLLPLAAAVGDMPRLDLSEDQARMVGHGRALPAADDLAEGQAVALFSAGELIAVYRRSGPELVADRVLTAA
ncbi:MAG TPA: tRNA pseudouridine(55) synthase TruB [Actinomycetota bacterium]|nr:tRNA pseudouridine(55) synthase TruB [Actinomycetota bacterium]